MGCSKSNFTENEYLDDDLENPQSNINSCKFKEIVVVDGFEVENGVLGLERDMYLSIVKFLDSSILRKV
jgi:hypothetical protein